MLEWAMSVLRCHQETDQWCVLSADRPEVCSRISNTIEQLQATELSPKDPDACCVLTMAPAAIGDLVEAADEKDLADCRPDPRRSRITPKASHS